MTKAWDKIASLVGKGLSETTPLMKEMDEQAWLSVLYQLDNCWGAMRKLGVTPLDALCLRDVVGDAPKDEKKGAWHRRFAREWFKRYGVGLSLDEASAIAYTVSVVTCFQEVRYDVTDKFDWKAGDFGDRGSCFFNESNPRWDKPALQQGGALALRIYDGKGKKGIGRAWVLPYWRINPQCDDLSVSIPSGSAFFINWYGLNRMVREVLLKHLFPDQTVQSIVLHDYVLSRYQTFKGDQCPIYVNDNHASYVGDAIFPQHITPGVEFPLPVIS